MEIDIFSVMERLKSRKPIFVSEADFQLEMAWTIKELHPDIKVYMEYCPEFDQKMHIDILLITNKGWIPIELKYKTKGCKIKIDNETYILANHSAKDVNCYLYLKDIQRIERIQEQAPSFIEGYTVMLTNEPAYLNMPSKENCVYSDFSLHEGAIKSGTMKWSEKTGVGTKKGNESPITLKGEYTVHWQQYCKVNETTSGTFYYTSQRIG